MSTALDRTPRLNGSRDPGTGLPDVIYLDENAPGFNELLAVLADITFSQPNEDA
jgi:hypothetical protein